MENKLEEVIGKNKYVDVSDMPKKDELAKNKLKFIDENEYIDITAANMSNFNPLYAEYARNLITKRDFKSEYSNIEKINMILPENCVKPVVFVTDNSISKGYIRGYLVELNGKDIKDMQGYIKDIKKKRYLPAKGEIEDIEGQLLYIKEKLIAKGIYDTLPIETFSADNLYINEDKKVLIMNMNYALTFNKKNEKIIDSGLEKTIKHLEKVRTKNEYKDIHGKLPNSY